jgi:hypothetical protein
LRILVWWATVPQVPRTERSRLEALFMVQSHRRSLQTERRRRGCECRVNFERQGRCALPLFVAKVARSFAFVGIFDPTELAGRPRTPGVRTTGRGRGERREASLEISVTTIVDYDCYSWFRPTLTSIYNRQLWKQCDLLRDPLCVVTTTVHGRRRWCRWRRLRRASSLSKDRLLGLSDQLSIEGSPS